MFMIEVAEAIKKCLYSLVRVDEQLVWIQNLGTTTCRFPLQIIESLRFFKSCEWLVDFQFLKILTFDLVLIVFTFYKLLANPIPANIHKNTKQSKNDIKCLNSSRLILQILLQRQL